MRSRDNRSVVVLMNESCSLSYDLKSLGGKYHSPGIVKYPLNEHLARGLARNEEEIENRWRDAFAVTLTIRSSTPPFTGSL